MKGRDPIKSSLAMDSFRNQGFSATSAICEIIDNSIEANSTNIHIKLEYWDKDPGHKYERVKQFTFVDDGDGMNKELLHDCLVLGESTRRSSARGIGKFGVGATLGGISQGRRIDIFSKAKGGQWLYTFLDLNLLDKGEGIPEPIAKDPPTDHQMSSGTVILWSKLDRVNFTSNNENDLFSNVGRIYRKFLTLKKIEDGKIVDYNPITILINAKNVEPYDPLFITYNRRKEDKEKPEHTSFSHKIGRDKTQSQMWVTISYLPESWWDTEGAGNKSENRKERQITDRNEGISIVREGREVLFGDIPYFKLKASKKKFIETDRWTGIEVAFNRDADELFEVQNNKSRLIISTEMREEISTVISETIEARRTKIDNIRKIKKSGDGGTESASDKPGRITIQKVAPRPSYTKEDEQTLEYASKQLGKTVNERKLILENLLKGYHQESTYDLDSLGPFVSYETYLNSLHVKYNLNHPFMKLFIDTLDSIAKRLGADPNDSLSIHEAKTMRVLFDILIASFGQAKRALGDPTVTQEIEFTFNSLITNWGDLSQRYAKKYQNDDS